MAKQEYDNNGKPLPKKPFKIKIAGFSFGIGHIVALALIVGIVALSSFISAENKRKADQLAIEQRQAELAILMQQQNNGEVLDVHAQIQASLSQQYGIAPDGFEWGYSGELIAIGNDDDHTCEDVVYMFLRSLSVLDFSTAERYSSGSAIISDYQNYYSIISEAITDYYRNFLRKQYKVSLTSMEVTGISDVAVFADGTEYLTIEVKVLDLTDKDFWRDDKDEMFSTMRVYRETEEDTTKLEQFVYDYIYEKYEDGTVGKKSHTIELIVSKQNGGGWLVSGDNELNAYLQYERGVDTARYILAEFSDWYTAVRLQEQLEAMGGGGYVAEDGEQYNDYDKENEVYTDTIEDAADTGMGVEIVDPDSDVGDDRGSD